MILELAMASVAISIFNVFSNNSKNKEIENLRTENKRIKQSFSSKFQKIDKILRNREARADYFQEQLKEREKENQLLENKLDNVHQRWDIIADARITSIPSNEKEWKYAKEIVSQPIQKSWKANKFSQTKDSILSNTNNEVGHEEVNQDFSAMSDEDFDKIIDEDSSSSSSGSSSDTQTLKPKPKFKPRTM